MINLLLFYIIYRFALKDLGSIHHFLGVEVVPVYDGFFLSQSQYITNILSDFHMAKAKSINTPMVTSIHLVVDGSSKVDGATNYRILVGLLQYLSVTRPDIVFVVNRLSQFMHAPNASRWVEIKRLLRYLKGSLRVMGCFYAPVLLWF